MNESIRTITFVGVAAVIALVAWATKPTPIPRAATAATQFKSFDVEDVADLKIVRYDEDEGKPNSFEVKKEGGRWTIPSHDSYPADAEEQLKKIASLFVELKTIATVSEDPATHELYGVKAPSDEATGDAKGFGRLLSIRGHMCQRLPNEKLFHLSQGSSRTDRKRHRALTVSLQIPRCPSLLLCKSEDSPATIPVPVEVP